MSNLLRIVEALSADNSMLISDEITNQIIQLINPDEVTQRGVQLLQDTLDLIKQQSEKDASIDADTSFGDDLPFQALKTSIHNPEVNNSDFSVSQISYPIQSDFNIEICTQDPIKENRFRDLKIKNATIEHIQRQQLARAKKVIKETKDIGCSIKNQKAVSHAQLLIPTLEKSMRETKGLDLQ